MASVAEVWRYPVKSMAGERLSSCEVATTGLVGDRRWALVDASPNRAGKPLTIREADRLMTYRARFADGRAEVLTPRGDVALIDSSLVSRLASETSRPLSLRELEGANFDDSPILVVNLATVASFGVEAGMDVDHRRFRANFYVDGLAPEEELAWIGRRVAVGEAELEVVSRCERCVVITKDPDTTATTPELLRILTQTRETCMGVYCRVTRPGRVAQGDQIHVV
jgi:MOSC domain-containing protein